MKTMQSSGIQNIVNRGLSLATYCDYTYRSLRDSILKSRVRSETGEKNPGAGTRNKDGKKAAATYRQHLEAPGMGAHSTKRQQESTNRRKSPAV